MKNTENFKSNNKELNEHEKKRTKNKMNQKKSQQRSKRIDSIIIKQCTYICIYWRTEG